MKKLLFALVMSLSALIARSTASAELSTPVLVSHIEVVSDESRIRWATCLSFTNNTARPIQAIKFQFVFQDAFDAPVASYSADRVGEFRPGVLIEGPENLDIAGFGNIVQKEQNCWVYPVSIASLSSVRVQVLKVRYGDGSVWVNTNPTDVYTASYMSNLDSEPHPTFIYCKGWIQMRYEFVRAHPDSPCWKNYKSDHEAWLAAHPSPSPSPTALPSPTSAASPSPSHKPRAVF